MEINILENKEEFETNFEDQDDVRLDGLGNIIRKIIGVGIREIWFDATFAICMRYICYKHGSPPTPKDNQQTQQ